MSTKLRKVKKSSMKTLILKADIIVSKYIRLRDKGVCITCGKKDEIKKMDCGHYITRACKNTRWDEQNLACQCPSCNRFHEGVKDVFALKLQKKYGKDILEKLNQKKNTVKKWQPSDLEILIETYKEKLDKIE